MYNWISHFIKPKVTVEENITEDISIEPCIVYIHGANQSSKCWNFIRDKLDHSNEILIDYSSMNRFYDNLDIMIDHLGDKPVFIVSHSLGGIYSLHLHKHCNVIGAVSISTPYRGSSAADWAKFIVPNYPLFKDVGRKSRPILEGHSINITVPWTQVVSTTGSVPYLNEENDGVVTISSMEHRIGDMKCVRVPLTHYEVMCSTEVVDIIKNDLKRFS